MPFQDKVIVRCALGAQASGFSALAAVDVVTDPGPNPGTVCQLEGFPPPAGTGPTGGPRSRAAPGRSASSAPARARSCRARSRAGASPCSVPDPRRRPASGPRGRSSPDRRAPLPVGTPPTGSSAVSARSG
jgi:hypothetical protein